MRRTFWASSLIGLSINFAGQPANALDPVTAGLIANGVVNLFSKKGPNPSLELLQANRQLLVELHGRLDNIEEGLAKVMVEVAQLPQEMFEQNLNAQTYNIGKEIAGIGNNYLKKIASLDHDRRNFGEGSLRFQEIKRDFRRLLFENILDISQLSANLMLREKSTNINALTILTAALVELSMRIELEKQFQASPGDVIIGARSYIDHIEQMLEEERVQSLASLIQGTIEVLRNDPIYQSWLKLPEKSLGEWTSANLTGRFRATCYTRQIQQNYTAQCSRIERRRSICVSIPGEGRDCDPPEEYTVYYNCTKTRWIDADSRMVQVELSSSTKIGEYALLESQASTQALPSIDASCPRSQSGYSPLENARKRIEKEASLLARRANVLSQLQATRDSAIQVKERLEKVAAGQFDEITPYTIDIINQITVLDLMSELNQIDRLENIRGTEPYRKAMLEKREAIQILIADQDDRIKEAFDKAAKAAKWNRTLGYLKTAAAVYRIYHWADQNLVNNDAKDLINTAQVARNGIEKDLGRTPASKLVLDSLDNLLETAGLWGGLVNAKRQTGKLNAKYAEISAMLPAGSTETYDIVVIGNQFWDLLKSDADQLRPSGATTAGQIQITGSKP